MAYDDERRNRNSDKECKALADYVWCEGMEDEIWWNDECSLCGCHMGDDPVPERCPWCGAKVVE